MSRPRRRSGAAGGGYWAQAPTSPYHEQEIAVPVPGTDRVLTLRTASHTFSHDRLDPGSRLLLSTVVRDLAAARFTPERIADLGAGTGALGLALAVRFPQAQVDLLEVNARAAALAEANAARASLPRVRVIACDVNAFVVPEGGYDLVVTNPPVRAGRQVFGPWLTGATRFLRAPGGRFYLVARTAQGARTLEALLRQALADAATIERESGYRVIRGTIHGAYRPAP